MQLTVHTDVEYTGYLNALRAAWRDLPSCWHLAATCVNGAAFYSIQRVARAGSRTLTKWIAATRRFIQIQPLPAVLQLPHQLLHKAVVLCQMNGTH